MSNFKKLTAYTDAPCEWVSAVVPHNNEIDQLKAENAKLRELVKCLVRCGKGLSCDECAFGDVRDVTVCGVLMYASRLGVETDE